MRLFLSLFTAPGGTLPFSATSPSEAMLSPKGTPSLKTTRCPEAMLSPKATLTPEGTLFPPARLSVLLRGLFAAGCFLLAACSTEEIRQTPDIPAHLVRVLFSPNGLGDLSYNDDVLQGILGEKQQNDFRLQYHCPADMEEAETLIRRWQAEDTDPQLYYTIMAGSEYEDVARRTLPPDERDNYLMFETPGEDFTISTFRFSGYGISFLAGLVAYAHTRADTAAYLGGQRGEGFIRECYDGFRDGYRYAGGREVVETYLSDGADGFGMPQRAYLLADSLYRSYPFLYVMAGGSNNGVYQYLREHPAVEGYTNGVDVDQSAYSTRIVGSVVKNMGRCVAGYISRWMAGEPGPHRTLYDLRSSYLSFELAAPYRSALQEVVDSHFELAVTKETEYEKK